MFISKSKKVIKPKAPTRRGAEAVVKENGRAETRSNSRTAEPGQHPMEREDRNASEGQPIAADVDPESSSRVQGQGTSRHTGEQDGTDAALAVADTTHHEGVPPRTPSGRGRAKVAVMSASPSVAPTTRDLSNAQAETSAPPADTNEPTALPTPPPTQVSAGGFIRKSKKVIAPRASTRLRRATAEIENEESQNDATDQGTTGATTTTPIVIDDQAETEAVAQRLVAALDGHSSRASKRLSSRSAPTGSSSGNAIVIDAAEQLANAQTSNAEITKEPATPGYREMTLRSGKKRKVPVVEIADTPEPEQTKIKRSRPKSRTASVKPSTLSAIQPSVENDGDHNDQEDVPKFKDRKRRRLSTPEDAETRKIEATEVRMDELINDTHQGKISQREKRLRQRDQERKAQRLEAAQAKARNQAQEIMDEGATNDEPAPATQPTLPAARSPSPIVAVAAPQFRIVNGTIVADETSRVLDRRAERTRAAEAVDAAVAVIEEDDLSRRINSRSFTKYDKPTRWTPAATALFHKGLQYFGLEFSMMACLFPGRSRRQLKAKFIREERADVNLVNALLRDRLPVPSQEELEAIMGKKLKDPAELQEELRIQKEALEEAQRLEDKRNEERRLARERGAEEEGRRVRSADEDEEEDDEEEGVEGEQAVNADDAGTGTGPDDAERAAEEDLQAEQQLHIQDEETNEEQ